MMPANNRFEDTEHKGDINESPTVSDDGYRACRDSVLDEVHNQSSKNYTTALGSLAAGAAVTLQCLFSTATAVLPQTGIHPGRCGMPP